MPCDVVHPLPVEVSVLEGALPHDERHLRAMKVRLGTVQMGVILKRDPQLRGVFHQTVVGVLILEVHHLVIWRMYVHLTAMHQSF